MINVRLQVSLVLGAERAMGTVKGGRFAAFVQQVPLEYVRILVALATSRAIMPTIVAGNGDGADGSIAVSAGMTRRTVKSGAPLRRQRCRHLVRGCSRYTPRSVRTPPEAREET